MKKKAASVKKPAIRATTPTTFKAMLKQLRTFMEKAPGTETQKMWDLMTALRGPDPDGDLAGMQDMKGPTTCVIRHTAFGEKIPNKFGCSSIPDHVGNEERRAKLTSDLSHFGYHAKRAFEALGLKWGEVNKQ